MENNKIEIILKKFESDIYSSQKNYNTLAWDLCYNYFYDFYKNDKISEIASPKNIENSCTRLGIYLANFKMYRQGTTLLEYNHKFYKQLIELISNANKKLWEIDLDSYTNNNITCILNFSSHIHDNLGKTVSENTTITQKTKILMGVFGNIPAFDENFCKGILHKSKPQNLLLEDLNKVKDFYDRNKIVIDKFSKKLNTITFDGTSSNIIYTKARVIDILGFQLGDEWKK